MTNPSGKEMPIGDLDNWRQVFVDDFNIDVPIGGFPDSVSATWEAYPSPWHDSSGYGTYSPKKIIEINAGILTKHIHTENGVAMVAAISPKLPKMIYGRFSICFKFDDTPDYKMAWLLWPNSGNRVEGEIDFPEMNLDAEIVWAFVHPTNRTSSSDKAWFNTPLSPGWHVCTIEWSPNLIVFILDGIEIGRSNERIPKTAMHWVLQTETALELTSPPEAANKGDVEIDWVAVWAYDLSAVGPVKPRQLALTAPVMARGLLPLSIKASPDVTQTKWVIDFTEVGYRKSRPFEINVDSTKFANGIHTIYPKGRDSIKWFDGVKQTMTVNNPWSLIAPEIATGIVTLGITPYTWFTGVKWVVDDVEIGSTVTGTEMNWDSNKISNGIHEIFVKMRTTKWFDGIRQQIIVSNY